MCASYYNTITKRSEIGSVEGDNMRSSPLYRSGLFVDYPSERATSPVMATTTH